ncbi:MAG: class I SAM-dependent methyltransferase, partial [Hyphomicrobiales bacterium]
MSESAEAASMRVQTVATCDLCGAGDFQEVAAASPDRCRTVMCNTCGLFFASPSLLTDAIEDFYDEEFEGDPGTNRRVEDGGIETRKVRREERNAGKWALPIIRGRLDVAGKRILDIRCQSGALAQVLSEHGAEVVALDPLQPNVDHARDRGTIKDVRFLPVTEYSRLDAHGLEQFDAITAMTVHTLGHLPSPKSVLRAFYGALKPGGFLFLDEKDVMSPALGTMHSVFDTGVAHFFHFTRESLRKYLEAVGFRVLECTIDPSRKTAFRHIRIVAQKPAGEDGASVDDRTFDC